jgi:hypothetical protein
VRREEEEAAGPGPGDADWERIDGDKFGEGRRKNNGSKV